MPDHRDTHITLKAARRFNRRLFMKTGLALGAVAATGPAYVRSALSSSGELNLLNWSDEFPDPVLPELEKATGIKVNATPFSQNEEQINKLQATEGDGFDVVQPTRDRAPQFKDLGVLAPIDTKKLKEYRQRIAVLHRKLVQHMDVGGWALSLAASVGHRGHFLAY